MLRCALLIALVAVLTPVFAQIEPAARPFLASTEVARPRFAIRALDYTICLIIHEGEAADAESCVRSAIDFSGRRLLAETESRFGEDEVQTKIVYKGGQARMTGFLKALLAVLSTVTPERTLQVFENPADPIPLRRMINSKTYLFQEGAPVLLSSQRLTRYRLNPNLDDALFTFGNGEAAEATSSGKRAPAKTPR